MRKLFTFLLALAASVGASHAAPAVAVNGKLPGAFSVSATKKVYFSQGNLQYNSNTQKWQFADQQYSYVGGRGNSGNDPQTGNNYVTTTGIANNNGIVDLFGWVGASSIWGNTADTDLKKYGIAPAASNLTNNPNGYGNNKSENLKSDWGTKMGTGWYTLTSVEWNYLLISRSTASGILYAKGTVNSVAGLIILPDNWSASYYALNFTNTADAAFTSNSINATDWANRLEANGAVFLPAAGARNGTNSSVVVNAGTFGQYWSSSPKTDDASAAYCASFMVTQYQKNVYPQTYTSRNVGQSVRLVSTVPPINYYNVTYVCNDKTSGTVPTGGQYAENTSVTVPGAGTLVKTGWTFNGWKNSENGNTYYEGGSFTITANTTLTAQWTLNVEQVNEVEALINAIGEVAYTPGCKAKIDAARNAYNALTDEQKALVSNYATLEAAEARYAYLTPVEITPNEDPKNEGTYYSTYYDGERLLQLPADVEAYAASISGNALALELIAEEGETLPAATAVILRSTVTPFTLLPQDEGAVDMSEVENALQGSDIIAPAPANTYVLSGTAEYGVGFYRINSENLKAHKAYVVYNSSNAPARMRFVFNEEKVTTGVDQVPSDQVQSTKELRDGQLVIIKNGVKYNAQGQIVK